MIDDIKKNIEVSQPTLRRFSMMAEVKYYEDIVTGSACVSSINLEFPKSTIIGNHKRLLEEGYELGKNDCYHKLVDGPTIVIHKR
jgi:hypothetical protein